MKITVENLLQYFSLHYFCCLFKLVHFVFFIYYYINLTLGLLAPMLCLQCCGTALRLRALVYFYPSAVASECHYDPVTL